MKPHETIKGLAVNRLVAGSNPARGATTNFGPCFSMRPRPFCQTSRPV